MADATSSVPPLPRPKQRGTIRYVKDGRSSLSAWSYNTSGADEWKVWDEIHTQLQPPTWVSEFPTTASTQAMEPGQEEDEASTDRNVTTASETNSPPLYSPLLQDVGRNVDKGEVLSFQIKEDGLTVSAASNASEAMIASACTFGADIMTRYYPLEPQLPEQIRQRQGERIRRQHEKLHRLIKAWCAIVATEFNANLHSKLTGKRKGAVEPVINDVRQVLRERTDDGRKPFNRSHPDDDPEDWKIQQLAFAIKWGNDMSPYFRYNDLKRIAILSALKCIRDEYSPRLASGAVSR